MSEATVAIDPPEDPPATLDKSYGFFVGPYAEFSVEPPIANSSILHLPKNIAPLFLSLLITVASYVAI